MQAPANIARCLGGMDFPANKEDIVEYAEDNDADDELLSRLERLPDKQYGNMADVMQGIGQSRQS
jgi:hypothetical protein